MALFCSSVIEKINTQTPNKKSGNKKLIPWDPGSSNGFSLQNKWTSALINI
jgi:hypothetical protein